MKLIVVLTLIALSCGEKLDRIYLPPNAQNSGGSDAILQTPNRNDDANLHRQVSGSFVTHIDDNQIAVQRPVATNVVIDSAAFERPNSELVDSNLETPNNVVHIGNKGTDYAQNTYPVEYVDAQHPGHYYQSIEQKPERAQASLERHAAILHQDYQNDGKSYAYSYETENGIYGEENSVAANGVLAQGSYSYVGDDGTQYSVRYTADENGFQPQGDHFPTPPPIPEDILKSLEQNARDEAAGIYDDGSYDDRKYGSEDAKEELGTIRVVANYPNIAPTVSSPVEHDNSIVIANSALLPSFRRTQYKNPVLVDQNGDLAPLINTLAQAVTPSTLNNGYLPPDQAYLENSSSNQDSKHEFDSKNRQPTYDPKIGYHY